MVYLCADDLLLLSDTEDNMQRMLDYVSNWCNKWRLRINYTKSAFIHFRNKGKQRSDYVFHIGNKTIDYASSYKYLGVVLSDNMDFNITVDTLFNSGGRALGSMISKIPNFKYVGVETYTKHYYSCVVPVTDYCSGVWGFRKVQVGKDQEKAQTAKDSHSKNPSREKKQTNNQEPIP